MAQGGRAGMPRFRGASTTRRAAMVRVMYVKVYHHTKQV